MMLLDKVGAEEKGAYGLGKRLIMSHGRTIRIKDGYELQRKIGFFHETIADHVDSRVSLLHSLTSEILGDNGLEVLAP
jgi:hypothetical protein